MYHPLMVSVMDQVARDMGDDVEIYLDGKYRLGQPRQQQPDGPEEDVLRVLSRAQTARWRSY